MSATTNLEVSEESTRSLADLEAIIEHGKQTFIEVGEALMEVRDRRLYREAGYLTFDDYLSRRWEFSRQRANQLIDSVLVMRAFEAPSQDEMTTMVVKPTNERQARALASLTKDDPEAAPAVMAEVGAEAEQSGKPVTADKIRKAVDKHKRNRAAQQGYAASLRDSPAQAAPPKLAELIRDGIAALTKIADALPDEPDSKRVRKMIAELEWLQSNPMSGAITQAPSNTYESARACRCGHREWQRQVDGQHVCMSCGAIAT